MTLIVFTSRISSRDPDRLDITRKSGGDFGIMFAPSWAILRPALEARRKAEENRKIADNYPIVMGNEARSVRGAADRIEDAAWAVYVLAYRAEMQESYRARRDVWAHMLAAPRRVLVCYCTDAARCHRTLLAGYLGKLGADVRGELPVVNKYALPPRPSGGEEDGGCGPEDDDMHGLRTWGDL